MTDLEYLRELAALSLEKRSPREYPHVTLGHAADLLETRNNDEKTDPRALVLRVCTHCGHPTPGEWTPPSD